MPMIPNMTSMIEKIPRMKAINRPIERKTERQKDRKTVREKERKTERQKDRKTERHKVILLLMIPKMNSMI
jgi:hypothetical protein